MVEKRQPPTPEEIDRLFTLFQSHLDDCQGVTPADAEVLAEVAKVWRTIQAIRRAGVWAWAGAVKFGAFVLKLAAVLTAAAYLIEQIKGWRL